MGNLLSCDLDACSGERGAPPPPHYADNAEDAPALPAALAPAFAVGAVLGQGTSGVVRAGTRRADGGRVALKFVRVGRGVDKDVVRGEVNLMRRLGSHANIVNLLGADLSALDARATQPAARPTRLKGAAGARARSNSKSNAAAPAARDVVLVLERIEGGDRARRRACAPVCLVLSTLRFAVPSRRRPPLFFK